MAARGTALRRLTLLLVGALVVHRLRYAAGYHDAAEGALAEHGHAYLGATGAVVALLAALTASRFASGLVGSRPLRLQPTSRLLPLWAGASALLASVFVVQELAEGVLSPGHPAGIVGVLEDGGWTGLVFAALVGGLLASAECGAAAVLVAEPAAAPAHGPIVLDAPPRLLAAPADRVAGAVFFGRRARGPPVLGS